MLELLDLVLGAVGVVEAIQRWRFSLGGIAGLLAGAFCIGLGSTAFQRVAVFLCITAAGFWIGSVWQRQHERAVGNESG